MSRRGLKEREKHVLCHGNKCCIVLYTRWTKKCNKIRVCICGKRQPSFSFAFTDVLPVSAFHACVCVRVCLSASVCVCVCVWVWGELKVEIGYWGRVDCVCVFVGRGVRHREPHVDNKCKFLERIAIERNTIHMGHAFLGKNSNAHQSSKCTQNGSWKEQRPEWGRVRQLEKGAGLQKIVFYCCCLYCVSNRISAC